MKDEVHIQRDSDHINSRHMEITWEFRDSDYIQRRLQEDAGFTLVGVPTSYHSRNYVTQSVIVGEEEVQRLSGQPDQSKDS